MNRRDLMKGVLTIPLARAAFGQVLACGNGNPCTSPANSLLVYLDGAFALILQRDITQKKIVGVTAFSPEHNQHLLKINTLPYPKYPSRHHLELDPKSVISVDTPCVSAVFKRVCTENPGVDCDPDKSFIRISLPTPKNIYAVHGRQAKIGSDTICLPQDHVLEYELSNGPAPTLSYDEAGQSLSPLNNVFAIEVGRDRPDVGGTHAISFHNTSILNCFGLSANANWKLRSIDDNYCAFPLVDRVPDMIVQRLRPFSTTLECKSGGLIAGNG